MTHSAETRAKISAAKMGHTHSAETRAKIAAKQQAEKGHNWQGDEVGYGGAHKRHRARLPRECAHCGTSEGRLDAALRHDVPAERFRWCVKRGRWYSPHTEDYLRLCRSCHNRYDGKVPPRRSANAVARA